MFAISINDLDVGTKYKVSKFADESKSGDCVGCREGFFLAGEGTRGEAGCRLAESLSEYMAS